MYKDKQYLTNNLLCSKIQFWSSPVSLCDISIKEFSPTQQISPETQSSDPVNSGHISCGTATNHWVSAMMSTTCCYTHMPFCLRPTLLPSLIFNILLQGLET